MEASIFTDLTDKKLTTSSNQLQGSRTGLNVINALERFGARLGQHHHKKLGFSFAYSTQTLGKYTLDSYKNAWAQSSLRVKP